MGAAQKLHGVGQSLWLDTMTRDLLNCRTLMPGRPRVRSGSSRRPAFDRRFNERLMGSYVEEDSACNWE